MEQMPHRHGFDRERQESERQESERQAAHDGTVVIDCDDCAVRGVGCQDCVVSVLLGVPDTLLQDERQALEVLAEAGMAPRLRLVPIHRHPERGGDTGAT